MIYHQSVSKSIEHLDEPPKITSAAVPSWKFDMRAPNKAKAKKITTKINTQKIDRM